MPLHSVAIAIAVLLRVRAPADLLYAARYLVFLNSFGEATMPLKPFSYVWRTPPRERAAPYVGASGIWYGRAVRRRRVDANRVDSAGFAGPLVVVIAGFAAFLALRLLLIHTSAADVLYWEEPYRLVAASEMLDGSTWAITDYQADHYQGGSLVVAMLAVPVFAVLGPTYGHLKLVAVGFSLLAAVLWIVLLWRVAGPASAVLGSWLFALPAPTVQLYQVHAMGSHMETAVFTAASFLLTVAIVTGARARWIPLLLGVVAGLGLWFCYSAATGVAACAVVWAVAGPRGSLRRGIPAALAGVALGLLPWLAYNLAHAFHGLDRLWELFDPRQAAVTGSTESLSTRLAALFAFDLPRSLGFPDTPDGTFGLATWSYYALVIVALVGLLPLALRALRHQTTTPEPVPEVARVAGTMREGTRRESDALRERRVAVVALLILTFVLLHLVAYLASAFRLDVEDDFIAYRFFTPLFPAAAGALAVGLSRLHTTRRLIGGVGIALALGLGAYGTATLLREHPGAVPPPVESGYKVMGLLTHLKYRDDLDRAVALLTRVRNDRDAAFFGFGWGLEYQYEKDADWSELVSGLARCTEPADYAAALSGVRWAVWQREGQSRQYANAGFRSEHHLALHTRVAGLAARLSVLLARGP